MNHDNGGRVRRAAIGALGLAGAVTIGVVAIGGGPASAQGDGCSYYCPSSTTAPSTTTTAPTTSTTAPTTTTTEESTTTSEETTTTMGETTTSGVTPTVMGETVTRTPVVVQNATAARPASAVAANVAFAG